MTRRMPRPEDVSREHIDSTIVDLLKNEKSLERTEVSLLTLHLREEPDCPAENSERYRGINERPFVDLLARLKTHEVPW